jgi:dienelactone hydrolase
LFSFLLLTGVHALAAVGSTSAGLPAQLWDMHMLSRAPRVYDAPGLEPLGAKAEFYEGLLDTPELRSKDAANSSVKSIFYEGVPYQAKPTRVFAYYGIPATPKGKKVPAMVLVHGGGGTAFESWVRLWNARGYAAIAMDTCGCIPKGEYSNWDRSEFGGPAGWGGFDKVDDPIQDQWTYHAVAAAILANSLLRSFPEVDKNRIGITGISWGGYLTSIVSGIDSRFRFAVPVYGCGYLGEDSAWLPNFKEMGAEKAAKWLGLWDPSVYLKETKIPIMWATGTNDFAYPLNSLYKCAGLPRNEVKTCVRINMPHGHGGAGENPEEIHAFADSFCEKGAALASFTGQGRTGQQVWVTWKSPAPIDHVELIYTRDAGNWPERKWESIPASLEGANRATATLPSGSRVYFVNLIDARNLVVSSKLVEVPEHDLGD